MSEISKKIPVAGPSISEKEIAYIIDAAQRGWYEHAGEYTKRFETAFANYTGRRFAISLPSCTSGLHLSLIALGIGVDDEVILPDITWIASAAPISYVGAKPVFADIDANTWCLSANTIEEVITERTKAIIVVNLYGHMPEWDSILALAKRYNLPVIEDAAESIGSRYKNRLAGTFGTTSCFSFHGSKTMTTGEGGMLLTDDFDIYQRCMIQRDHGRMPGDIMFRNIEIGHKYKMSDLQAALGLAQLERIEELISKKREIFSWYSEAVNTFLLNPSHIDVYNSYWMTTAIFKKNFHKDIMMQKLAVKDIGTRPFFDPLSSLKPYRSLAGMAPKRNKTAYSLSPYALNLPSALSLEQSDVIRVVAAIEEIMCYA